MILSSRIDAAASESRSVSIAQLISDWGSANEADQSRATSLSSTSSVVTTRRRDRSRGPIVKSVAAAAGPIRLP